MASALEIADELVELGTDLNTRSVIYRESAARKVTKHTKMISETLKEARETTNDLLATGEITPSDAGLALEVIERLDDCRALCDTIKRASHVKPEDVAVLAEALYSTLDDANDLMSQLPL